MASAMLSTFGGTIITCGKEEISGYEIVPIVLVRIAGFPNNKASVTAKGCPSCLETWI
jgi:hypothetical protein